MPPVFFKWWCRPALCAPMERQGRRGESATKKRRPRLPQRRDAARLYALRKEGAGHNLQHTSTSTKRERERAATRARAAAVTARGGRDRERQGGRGADEVSWNSALAGRWKHWRRDYSQRLPNNYCHYKLVLLLLVYSLCAFFVRLHFF